MNTRKERWKSWFAIVVSFVAVTLGGFHHTAWSEDLPPPQTQPAVDLEQRVRILERKLELADEKAAEKAKTGASVAASDKNYQIVSADGAFKVRFRAQAQVDYRHYFDDSNPVLTNGFLTRRLRPYLDLTAYNVFNARLQPDFAGGNASLVDAYIEYVPTTAFGLRFGKTKQPVGLERLQSDPENPFAENALSTNLVANRDLGVLASGHLNKGVLNYAVGVFNGGPDGANADTDTHSDKTVAARLFVQPFAATTVFPVQKLGFGIGSSYGHEIGTGTATNLPSYRTEGQQAVFSYAGTTWAGGKHLRLAPQAHWYWNSVGLLGEFILSQQELQNAGRRLTAQHEGWQVSATWVLTGEEPSYAGVKPATIFDPKAGTWGAFELVGRYSRLAIDKDVFPVYATPTTAVSRAESWITGVNWYLNNFVRVVSQYAQTNFDGGATRGDRETERVLLSRVQFVF
jgi:phosphate-selective porin OprO/OprP